MNLTRATTIVLLISSSSSSLAENQHSNTRGRQLPATTENGGTQANVPKSPTSPVPKPKPKPAPKPAPTPTRAPVASNNPAAPVADRTGEVVFQARDPKLIESAPCVDYDTVKTKHNAEVCYSTCLPAGVVGCCRVGNGAICDTSNGYLGGNAPVSKLQLSNMCPRLATTVLLTRLVSD
jgi:hypothetical protein